MRFLFSVLLLLFSLVGCAQLPFAQLLQVPMATNPSMVGNKNKNRVSAAFNELKQSTDTQNNLHLSFDSFLRKWGAGIGVFYQRQQYSSLYPSDNAFEALFPRRAYQAQSNTFGFSISPKYNVMDKVNAREIHYSVSPSLYVTYSDGKRSKTDNFNYSYRQNCTCIDPSGTLYLDSASYTQSHVKERVLTAGFGWMYTSNNVLLYARLEYETSFFTENFEYYKFRREQNQTLSSLTLFTPRLYALQGILGGGITFPAKPEAKLTFTPFALLAYRKHLNMAEEKKEGFVQNESLRWRKANEITTAHLSTNIRYQKLIVGAAFTKTGFHDFYGISFGYQNSWSKTLATFTLSQTTTFAEVGTGVWF